MYIDKPIHPQPESKIVPFLRHLSLVLISAGALSFSANTSAYAGFTPWVPNLELKSDDASLVELTAVWEEAPIDVYAGLEHLGIEVLQQQQANAASKEAQVEYLSTKFNKDEKEVRSLVELAWEQAEKQPDVTPELILAVMQKESSLRPEVKSNYGAVGLMQVVPRFHPDKLKKHESPLEPEVNVRVGAQILQEYLDKAQGDWKKALRKYSGNARGYPAAVLQESNKLAALGALAKQRSNEVLPSRCPGKAINTYATLIS